MAEGHFVVGSLKPQSLVGNWIGFSEPGVVRLTTGKVDIGQGITTALAQIAAEELCVDLDRVSLIIASTDYSPDEGVTSGSLSVQQAGDAIRRASATVRAAALKLCAQRWNAAAESIALEDGKFRFDSAGATASYWDLPLQEVLAAPVDSGAALKPYTDFKLVGQEVPRLDLPSKVYGKPSYIHDIVLPDMLHARLVRHSNRFARLLDIGITEAELRSRYPGIRIVRDGNFLGVLAPTEYQADWAASRILATVQWDTPPVLPRQESLKEFLRSTPSRHNLALDTTDGRGVGDLTLRAEFSRQFIAHASIGPSCAIAHWTDTGLEVWSHSQGIFNLRTAIKAFLSRIHPDRVDLPLTVHHAEGAGCYGHNPADDVAMDAVLLSRAAEGRPVRLLWSRADELACGPFGPAQLVSVGARLSEAGDIAAWHLESWANGYTARPGRHGDDSVSFLGASQLENPIESPISIDPPLNLGGGSDRNSIPEYAIPLKRIESHRLHEMPLRTSALRALGGHPNVFAIESVMDELAEMAGRDPIEFRLAHLEDPRSRAVVERCIADAHWWGKDKAEGEGHGFGYARYKHSGAWCAVAVRLMLEDRIRVIDASVAVDVGLAINPDGVRNQIEGGLIQSCSWTLNEAINFTETEVTTRSWADYPILSFSDAPNIICTVIDRPGEPSLGAGEASIGPTAAAIGNAVYDAMGVRVRDMPITFEKIVALLA